MVLRSASVGAKRVVSPSGSVVAERVPLAAAALARSTAKYPCKHTEGVLWMAVWLAACGNNSLAMSGEVLIPEARQNILQIGAICYIMQETRRKLEGGIVR